MQQGDELALALSEWLIARATRESEHAGASVLRHSHHRNVQAMHLAVPRKILGPFNAVPPATIAQIERTWRHISGHARRDALDGGIVREFRAEDVSEPSGIIDCEHTQRVLFKG